MIGLTLMTFYVLIFLIRQFAEETSRGLTSAHILLVLQLIVLIVTKFYLWPEVWMKRVIVPTQRTFLRAKCNLIEGVKTVERVVGPFKAPN